MKSKALVNIIRKAFIAQVSFFVAASAFAAPSKVGDFGLIDHKGDQYQLTRLGNHKAVVIISQANNCSASLDLLHRYKLLRTTWQPLGVEFLMINSSKKDNLKSIRNIAEVYDINFPIMHDESQLVAETLGIHKVGEILVLDPRTKQLVYRGPLDQLPVRREPKSEGTSFLNDALASVVEGKHVGMDTVEIANPEGCDLDVPTKQVLAKHQPDYASDVAPILEKNCTHCHVEGGIGPFAMNSYEMIRGWAPMIREVVMTKRMPPMQVDPTINHFENANYLSVADTQTLIHWLDAGAPRGKSGKDPLKNLKPIEGGWQLGEPDLVVDVPAFTVPTSGVLDYFNNVIKLNFDEDKYVKAVQFIPGDTRVLHHLLAYITSPENDEGVLSEENVRDFLEGYAPGKIEATTFPKGTGVFIPKGYDLTMQMHYTTFGKEVVDQTKVGLWFYDKDEKPERKYLTKSVSFGGSNLVLRPNEAEHDMNNSFVFEKDTTLYAMRPHMHYRGKAFRFSAIYPDGRREILMNVPNYSFAWQPTYRLTEPKFLPAGTRVVNDATFDNSMYNPGNPDPNKTVKGGAQSWDEMFIGYYTYTEAE